MLNPYAGEAQLKIGGTLYVLKLTLGALAALEERLQTTSLMELVQRFEHGKPRAADIVAVLEAGLFGGGHSNGLTLLTHQEIEGGAMAAGKAAVQLLARGFGVDARGENHE